MHPILLVESEPGQRRLMQEFIERKLGVSVTTVATAREALYLTEKESQRYSTLIIEMHLPDMSGLQVVRQLRQNNNLVPVVLLSTHGDMHVAVEAMRAGANDFLTKPVPAEKLLQSLHYACGIMRERSASRNSLNLLTEDGHVRRMHDVEAEIIAHALHYYKGRMSEIARRLGIGRSTLYRKVSDLGLLESTDSKTAATTESRSNPLATYVA